MEFLGVGPSELVFIIIIALIILGPKDMQKAGRMIGKFMRDIVTSDGWKMFQQTSKELQNLPNRLMREANEEINQLNTEINTAVNGNKPQPGDPGQPPGSQPTIPTPETLPENKIAPPATPPNSAEADQEKNA